MNISLLLQGAAIMGYAVISLFFLRFWRETSDRLFAIFALSFFILAANRLAMSLMHMHDEAGTPFYLVRLAAFLLILWAIVDKNRADGRS